MVPNRPGGAPPTSPGADPTPVASGLLLIGALEKSARWILAHSFSVAEISWTLATAAGEKLGDPDRLWRAGMLHDIGKLGIGRTLLDKPGRLTLQEFAEIKNHCNLGYLTLERLLDDWMLAAASLHHHERFDGKGYPTALAGTAIPLSARVVAVADSYDAMRAERPYDSCRDHRSAAAEIRRGSGGQFDPAIVELFESVGDEIAEGFDEAHGLCEASILAVARDRLLPN